MFPTQTVAVHTGLWLWKTYQKTAFSTHPGHFEMSRMAFGHCNSQATYQRVIDKVLHSVKSTE